MTYDDALTNAVKEIKEVEEWQREQERLKEEVRTSAIERDRRLITTFVHEAIDKDKLLRYDGIFQFIEDFVNERNR